MKLLFLDIDGVLNHHKTKQLPQQPNLDKECIQHLNSILDTVTDVKVILSSNWRVHASLQENKRDLKRFGYKGTLHAETAITRNVPQLDHIYLKMREIEENVPFPAMREFEIYTFIQCLIKKGVVVENVCVIDDMLGHRNNSNRESIMFFGSYFNPYGVRTDRDVGLDFPHALLVMERLLHIPFKNEVNASFDYYALMERLQREQDCFEYAAWALQDLKRDTMTKIQPLL